MTTMIDLLMSENIEIRSIKTDLSNADKGFIPAKIKFHNKTTGVTVVANFNIPEQDFFKLTGRIGAS